jgi:hypothetical protein
VSANGHFQEAAMDIQRNFNDVGIPWLPEEKRNAVHLRAENHVTEKPFS